MPQARDVLKSRRVRAPIPLYLAFLLGWVATSGLIVRAATRDEVAQSTTVAAGAFVAVSGLLVLLVVRRDVVTRRRVQVMLDDRQALIESIAVVTDPRLSQLPLHRLLDELLDRARTVLQADTASVFLLEAERDQLRRTAISGPVSRATDIVVVGLGRGVIGRVAVDREIVALPDAPKQPAIPKGTASLVAAPLVAEGELLGVMQVGTNERREFSDSELNLVQLVVDRMAVAIEGSRLEREAQRQGWAADAGRRRLALLADAGEILARSFDTVGPMADALGDTIVPEYADYFAYYDVDEERQPRLVGARAGPEVARRSFERGWTRPVAAALDSAEPKLVWGEPLVQDWPDARMRGITSLTVVPVTLRGTFVGVLVLGTAGRRRGLRPGDLSIAVDLAARLAVAVERVQLAAETRRTGSYAALRANQLQRLTEAAFAVNAALSVGDLAAVVADQATRVLRADAATVDLIEDDGTRSRVAAHGTADEGAVTGTTELTDSDGSVVGAITVTRVHPLGREEKNVLRSLGQIASVALTNARLYETVHASESRMRALYDASPVGIVQIDANGRATRWNRAAEDLFGWPPSDDDTEPRALPANAHDFVAGALATDVAATMDLTVGALDAELVVVPLGDTTAGQRSAVLTAVDLTERKHVAEQLQQAQRMEAMARMAGGIAHDFNNMLMVITGYADLLLRRPIEDQIRMDVEAMRDAAKRAAEFTRKLLTISRRQLVQLEVVDVAAAIASLEDVLPMMLGSDVTVDVTVEDPPPVLIDPAQFEQMLLNLAINAKDAMPKGGTLTIRARHLDESGEWALLTVSDTGDGMDAATVEHCFEPFFSTKDRTKGTGLGLSTVYGSVTQAGGEIDVESAVGVGTTFTIRLPAAPETDRLAAVAGDDAVGLLRVLVVDDDSDVRAIVADMLELEGHEVVSAPDGAAALLKLDETDPDVLLTDIVMPGMRGTELAAKAQAAKPDLAVILMSSHLDDELAATERNDARVLAKPFSRESLVLALASTAAPAAARSITPAPAKTNGSRRTRAAATGKRSKRTKK